MNTHTHPILYRAIGLLPSYLQAGFGQNIEQHKGLPLLNALEIGVAKLLEEEAANARSQEGLATTKVTSVNGARELHQQLRAIEKAITASNSAAIESVNQRLHEFELRHQRANFEQQSACRKLARRAILLMLLIAVADVYCSAQLSKLAPAPSASSKFRTE